MKRVYTQNEVEKQKQFAERSYLIGKCCLLTFSVLYLVVLILNYLKGETFSTIMIRDLFGSSDLGLPPFPNTTICGKHFVEYYCDSATIPLQCRKDTVVPNMHILRRYQNINNDRFYALDSEFVYYECQNRLNKDFCDCNIITATNPYFTFHQSVSPNALSATSSGHCQTREYYCDLFGIEECNWEQVIRLQTGDFMFDSTNATNSCVNGNCAWNLDFHHMPKSEYQCMTVYPNPSAKDFVWCHQSWKLYFVFKVHSTGSVMGLYWPDESEDKNCVNRHPGACKSTIIDSADPLEGQMRLCMMMNNAGNNILGERHMVKWGASAEGDANDPEKFLQRRYSYDGNAICTQKANTVSVEITNSDSDTVEVEYAYVMRWTDILAKLGGVTSIIITIVFYADRFFRVGEFTGIKICSGFANLFPLDRSYVNEIGTQLEAESLLSPHKNLEMTSTAE